MLSIGATGIAAFVGMNGASEEDRIGLAASDVEFGLLLATDQENAARKWTTLVATTGEVGFVGNDDVTISGDKLSVEVTRAGAGDLQIDFLAQPIDVPTGTGTSLTIDLDTSAGPITRAAGQLELAVGGFFQTSGEFAIEQTTHTFKLSDGSSVATDVLLIGANDVSAFVGNHGGTDDAIGFEIDDVDFGLVLATDQSDSSFHWTALKATANKVGFVGIDGVTANASDVVVEINVASGSDEVLDLATTPFNVRTGPASSIELNLDGDRGDLIRAQAHLALDLFGFVTFDGDFGIEKSVRTVTLSDSSVMSADVVTIGARDASAFVGLNGGSENQLGLSIGGVDFGLALMTDRAHPERSFTTLQANADSAAFEGIDGLTVAASDLAVAINRGITLPATAATVTELSRHVWRNARR